MQISAELIMIVSMAGGVSWLIVRLTTTPIKERLDKLETKQPERDSQLFGAINGLREEFHRMTLAVERRLGTTITVEECNRRQHECLTTKTHIITKGNEK